MHAGTFRSLSLTRDMMLASVSALVLMAFLLAVDPALADSSRPTAGAPQPANVARTLEQLSKGRVTTLDRLVAEATWRKSAAGRLSAAIAALEADTNDAAAATSQTAERPARAE